MSHKKTVRYASAELRCTKCKKKDNDLQGVMIAHDKGRYVTYEDFKELDNLCKKLMKQYSDISCENIKLRAEVERLRYVGDGMAVMVGHIEVTGDAHRMMLELSKEWETAKEGKPTK